MNLSCLNWDWIDLDFPGMEKVKESLENQSYAETAEALREYFLRRNKPVWFLGLEERLSTLNDVRQHYRDDIEREIRIADEIVDRTFLFRYPWDMERTQVPVRFKDRIDWEFIPDHDPEWVYMLNRHRYWIALGQAYWFTGKDKYARTFAEQLEDWIDRNPLTPQSMQTTWRTIDAGIRLENWLKALSYLMDSPYITPRLFAKLLASLHQHGAYISAHMDGWRRISNWGVLENHGLFELAVFAPMFKEAAHWRELSLSRMKEMALIQVAPDGMHWEQSPMYHHEVLHSFMEVLGLARCNGIELDPVFARTVRRMAYASLYMAKPNHHQPMQGDSDDNDVRDMLTKAAYLLGDGVLKFGAFERFDFDTFMQFGVAGAEHYRRIELIEPTYRSYPFDRSGNYVMRSGWGEQDLYLFFDCAPMGGGHGHADLLHIDIHAYGRDLLTDSGRYNYSDYYPLRNQLKSCESHNTTIVDDIPFTECTASWTFSNMARPVHPVWITDEQFDYVEGSHDGYEQLEDPVRPVRRILFLKPHFWLLADSFYCREAHTFSQYFHFSPGEVSLNPATLECRTVSKDEANIRIIPVTDTTEELKARLRDGMISYEYNLAESNQYVEYRLESSGFASMFQLLVPQKAGDLFKAIETSRVQVLTYNGDLVSDHVAEAVSIEFLQTGERHIIVLCHKKPSMHIEAYIVDGVQCYGEVVWIRRRQGELQAEIMVVK
ncbi:alginate lyase family protein [Paenibacillus lentus]|uniref:alginate lyase family protein n=1 Tax=Paenibacillus lentus TaxID=1338368 RepID=UPI00364790D0